MTHPSRRVFPITVCVLMTIFVLRSSVVWADSLTGRVLDPTARPVAGAQLRLFDRKTGELRSTTSSAEGEYSFRGIPKGEFLLEAAASSASLTASRAVSITSDETLDLELKISGTSVDVVVTASGTPLSVQEIAKAQDVVESEEIASRVELSIADAIRTLPGIRVQTLGGPGSFTSIRTRGLRSQDTAVLLDGLRFRDAASIAGDATGFLGSMATVDTERIELLRGSGSSLYGSNALGGVVNIISRPGGGPTHGEFRAEGGGLGMLRGVAGVGGGLASDRLTYSASVAHINVTRGVRDGMPYRNTSSQGSARYNFTPQLSVIGRVWFADSYLAATESPRFHPNLAGNSPLQGPVKAVPLAIDQLELFEQRQPFSPGNATYIPSQMDPDGRNLARFFSAAGILQHQVSAATSYRVAYQRVNTKRTFIDGPAGPGQFEPGPAGSRSRFNGYTDTLQARLDQQAGRYNLITAGYEFEHEKYYTFSAVNAADNAIDLQQRSHALFVQDQIRLMDSRLQLTIAARAQRFDLKPPTFAGFTSPYVGASTIEPPSAYTGDAALAYFFRGPATKVRAHVGNSWRAPSGYERFGGGSGSYYGDPRLSPERSIGVDGGVDQWLFGSKLQMTATVFYTNLQQTVLFANSLPAGDPFTRSFGYANGGGGIARGVEVSTKIAARSTGDVQASYTYVNSDSRTVTIAGSNYYKNLAVSTHTFGLTATQWIGTRTSIVFDMSALSDYTMTLGGGGLRQFVFDGPVKADVVLHHEIPVRADKNVDFYVKAENILNRRIYESGFLGPRAWAIAGLRLQY
jgi:vitamin B12 transporter